MNFKILFAAGENRDYQGEIVYEPEVFVLYEFKTMPSFKRIIEDLDSGYLEIDMDYKENQKHAVVDEKNRLKQVKLFNEKGEEYLLDVYEQYDSDTLLFFRESVVGIIDCRPYVNWRNK